MTSYQKLQWKEQLGFQKKQTQSSTTCKHLPANSWQQISYGVVMLDEIPPENGGGTSNLKRVTFFWHFTAHTFLALIAKFEHKMANFSVWVPPDSNPGSAPGSTWVLVPQVCSITLVHKVIVRTTGCLATHLGQQHSFLFLNVSGKLSIFMVWTWPWYLWL